MRRFSGKLVAVLVGTALSAAYVSDARGTALTFDITGLVNQGAIPDVYGDNVSSLTSGNFSYGGAGGFTPNITTAYVGKGTQQALNFWVSGYSDLTNVVEYEPDGDPGYLIKLLAEPGFQVALTHFDMGNFGGAVTLPSIRVLDHNGTALFTQTNLVVPANSLPHLSFDFPVALVDSALTIDVDTTGLGGATDNIGLDNITFSQVSVPEPTTVAFVGALSLLPLRRTRRL